MASKSRGSKSGTKAGSTRKSKTAPLAEDVMTSSAALALVVDTEAAVMNDSLPTAIAIEPETSAPVAGTDAATIAEPAKPVRSRTRKVAATSTPDAEDAAPTAAPRKRSRKSAPKAAATESLTPESLSPESPSTESPSPTSPLTESPLVETIAPAATAEFDVLPVAGLDTEAPVSDAVGGDPQEAADDARYADALAGAFLYAPEPEPELEPEQAFERDDTPIDAPAPTDTQPTGLGALGTPSAPAPAPTASIASATSTAKADLPFIIDVPREAPVVDEAPADEWVERILKSDPRELSKAPRPPVTGEDEWVDQVLEPSNTPIPVRPRPRVQPARTSNARSTAKPASKSVAKPAPKAAAPGAAPGTAGKPAPAAATSTRWWVALPVLLLLAVGLFASRSGRTHAPVPEGVLGTWTTAFWLYEHQTLEIKPDTVVATLDEADEGRYPITKVETVDAGRELSVKITYRNDRGEDKEIDFLADKDPTTALRFRAHSGLVWVKAE